MRFLQSAPERGGLGTVPIKVALMSQADAQYWHSNVQPDSRALKGPDALWNWPVMRRWLPLVEFARGRRAPAYVTWAEGAKGTAVPVGMIMLSEGYSALDDRASKCAYVWFMAAAPESAMKRLGIKVIPKLGRVLIDIAVSRSHSAGYGGRIGLHAAPAGGDKLVDLYRNIGLTRLSAEASLPGYLRKNDGRYFYLDELQARQWSNSLNSYR